jgi:APA family basic amino acid/polyamine antiporter
MKLKLKRELGLFEVTVNGVGIILGAGIYALIGPAAGLAGNSLWLSFVIGAFIASFTGLSYAELSTMFPKAAAEYTYVRKAYGGKFLSFLVGWLLVFTGVVSTATVTLGFAGYFYSLFGEIISISKNFLIILTASILIVILSFINFLGIKESSKFNIIFTAIEALALIFIILIGLPYFGRVNYLETTNGLKGILSGAALIFFAYIGFEDISNIAEEIKNPKKVIPRAIILAILITTLLYVLTSISVVSLVDWRELGNSDTSLALAASKVLGTNAYWLISFVALFATANTALIMMIATSRMMYGMARDKSLPEELTLIHERTRTPWIAAIVVMVFSIVFLFFGKITVVANITSLSMFITFAAVNLSLIWLRYTMPKMKRAFKVPLNVGKFPLLAFFGTLICLFMITQFRLELIVFSSLVIVIGIIVYEVYIKKSM